LSLVKVSSSLDFYLISLYDKLDVASPFCGCFTCLWRSDSGLAAQ
jgi:hypothetical protein